MFYGIIIFSMLLSSCCTAQMLEIVNNSVMNIMLADHVTTTVLLQPQESYQLQQDVGSTWYLYMQSHDQRSYTLRYSCKQLQTVRDPIVLSYQDFALRKVESLYPGVFVVQQGSQLATQATTSRPAVQTPQSASSTKHSHYDAGATERFLDSVIQQYNQMMQSQAQQGPVDHRL